LNINVIFFEYVYNVGISEKENEMTKETQLHELIAVEPDLKSRANQDRATYQGVLNHPQNFIGEVRVYRPLEEGGETFPDEVTNITELTEDVVENFNESYGSWLDVTVQKEITNAHALADVVVDGEVIFKNLPAPALLNLEARLSEIKEFYKSLPVLDLTETWTYDSNTNVWLSAPRKTFRAKKLYRNHVKAEATKEHPAQVEVYTEDVRVGEWTKIVRSSAITSSEKKEILHRIDDLALAVKRARQRANTVLAETPKIAAPLFEYINGKVFS